MGARFDQEWAVVATIDPAKMSTSGATSSTTSAWTDAVDISKFGEVAFIVAVNTIAASSGVSFVVYSDSASATGGMTASVAAMTQKVNADDDEQSLLVIDARELAAAGDRYVRGKLTVAPTSGSTATATVAVIGLGGRPRYGPASDNDLASMTEVKT